MPKVPNAKALDNISKCRWLLPPDDPNYRAQTKPKPPAAAAAPKAPAPAQIVEKPTPAAAPPAPEAPPKIIIAPQIAKPKQPLVKSIVDQFTGVKRVLCVPCAHSASRRQV
jgi:hypothetical protein